MPTGVQDYRPALYGGVSAVELGRGRRPARRARRRRRRPRAAPGARLHGRVAQLGHQQLGRHDAAHQRRRRRASRRSTRIRDAAARMRDALEQQDWTAVGRRHERPSGRPASASRPGVTTRGNRRAARTRAVCRCPGRQGLRRRRRRLPRLPGRPRPSRRSRRHAGGRRRDGAALPRRPPKDSSSSAVEVPVDPVETIKRLYYHTTRATIAARPGAGGRAAEEPADGGGPRARRRLHGRLVADAVRMGGDRPGAAVSGSGAPRPTVAAPVIASRGRPPGCPA